MYEMENNEELQSFDFQEIDVADDERIEESEFPKNITPNITNTHLSLRCDVGHVQMTLAELTNLRSGQFLHVAELPPKVRLMLNDQLVAMGVLVSLNGQLGVRIE